MMTDRMTGIDNPPTLCCDGPITCQDLFPIYLFPKLQNTEIKEYQEFKQDSRPKCGIC